MGLVFEVDILTLFPTMFTPLEVSMVGRARKGGRLELRLRDIRAHAEDKHRTTDDTPFGGGGGMVMKPEPIFETFEAAQAASKVPFERVVLMTPQGATFTQDVAE